MTVIDTARMLPRGGSGASGRTRPAGRLAGGGPGGDTDRMPEPRQVLADQLEYYRRRAAEYDATAYGDVAAARPRIAALVAEMRPAGRVLEIACGTGLWTEALADWAAALTAIDAAPEVVE